MRSLAPLTPYEGVIAEDLIAIEWELLQQRRMREARLRQMLREAICKAAMAGLEARHEAALVTHYEAHIKKGGTEDNWKAPFSFDVEAAEEEAEDLAARAISRELGVQRAAHEEITALGMDPVDLMGEAYGDQFDRAARHSGRIVHLEARRREVKRDLDALQAARPIEAEVVGA